MEDSAQTLRMAIGGVERLTWTPNTLALEVEVTGLWISWLGGGGVRGAGRGEELWKVIPFRMSYCVL